MRVAAAFAGIGGLEHGLQAAGHEIILASEIDPAARAVLGRRLEAVAVHGDISCMDRLPKAVEMIAAGFPCQDLSQAGTALGMAGDRSSLVKHVFRLGQPAHVTRVLLENVPFMLQLDRGAAMLRIVTELEAQGFRWAWRVVDTFGFGLPQRRERVLVYASRTDDPADVILADDNPLARPGTAVGARAHGFYWTEGRGGLGWAVDAVPTLKIGSAIGIPSPPAILLPDGSLVTPDIRDAERLQGFQEGWTEPALEVAKKGARWRLVGGAVSTPVSRWVGERLSEPGAYDPRRDMTFVTGARLPRAARFDGKQRHAVDISPDPLGVRPEPLMSFLRYPGAALSQRATNGFLGRTRTAKLRFAPGFIEAVEAYLDGFDSRQIIEKRAA